MLVQTIKFLESDELEEEVQKLADDARINGIAGVPVTIIDGKWAVTGGQQSDVYIQVISSPFCPLFSVPYCATDFQEISGLWYFVSLPGSGRGGRSHFTF